MDLIEAYYAVANHLQEQAASKNKIADMLGKMADAMSEQRMREVGCTRSHPHEDMNPECEKLTEIARENNRRAQQQPGDE